MSLVQNKRGAAEDISWPTIIYVLLLMVYIGVFLVFIRDSLSGATVMEEVYAKKVALMLDNARPNTEIRIDVTEIIQLAIDKKKTVERAKMEAFRLDAKKNIITVSLGSGDGGYAYSYFSNYKVETLNVNIIPHSKSELTIKIGGPVNA
jgi:hypothetical protein